MKINPPIEPLILTVRNERVMLAADLAEVYDVETRALTQAVKRNAERFPEDFIFQLTAQEFDELKSQGLVTSDGRTACQVSALRLHRARSNHGCDGTQ